VTAISWWLLPGLSDAAPGPSVPAISGTAQVGQTLTESHANWSFNPFWFAYQWEDCNTAGQSCDAIKGASDQTYVVSSSDVGHTLRVQETAAGWTGNGQATSAATGVASTPPAPAPPHSTPVAPTAPDSSTTALITLESGAVTDQAVTLIATVTSSSAAKLPSGSVTFQNRGAPIAGCQNEPIAPTGQSVTVSCQTSFAASVAQLTAAFTPSPGSAVGGSVSAPVAFTVQPDPTTTTVDVSRPTVRAHTAATYTATVRPSYVGPVAPSQSVAFLDNGQPVPACASQPLTWSGTAASATCSIRYTRPGQHLITARYSGDSSFASSTSSAAELVDAIAGRIHPVLNWSFYYAPRYTRVLVLTVGHLPTGAQVQVSCAGKGCPLGARAVSLHRASPTGGGANLRRMFGSHRLRPGTVITVTVERPNWIGKRYRFKIQAARPPRLGITCQAPGLPPGVGC
jgi:Bacterial Ig-like domain (group 3)